LVIIDETIHRLLNIFIRAVHLSVRCIHIVLSVYQLVDLSRRDVHLGVNFHFADHRGIFNKIVVFCDHQVMRMLPVAETSAKAISIVVPFEVYLVVAVCSLSFHIHSQRCDSCFRLFHDAHETKFLNQTIESFAVVRLTNLHIKTNSMLVVIVACFVHRVEIARKIADVNVLVRICASCLCLFVHPGVPSVRKMVDLRVKVNVDVLCVRVCVGSWSHFQQ